MRQRDGPAQGDAVRRHATHHRIGAVEKRHRHVGRLGQLQRDALLGQEGRQPAARGGQGVEGARHFQVIELAAQEGQPLRLVLLDHVELDALHQRQAPAGQALGDGLGLRVVSGLANVSAATPGGRLLQHRSRGTTPALQSKSARADRMRTDVAAIAFHHLAGHCAGKVGRRQGVDEARLRIAERQKQ